MSAVDKLGRHWCTKLKSNRILNGEVGVEHRRKTTYGSYIAMLAGGIEVFVVKDGAEFFSTLFLTWKPNQVKKAYRKRWLIEEVIKLLKSELGFETCQARSIPTIKAHAYLCLISFNMLEMVRVKHKISNLYRIRSVLFNQPIPLKRSWNLDPILFA